MKVLLTLALFVAVCGGFAQGLAEDPGYARKVSVDFSSGATLTTFVNWLQENKVNFVLDPKIVRRGAPVVERDTQGGTTTTTFIEPPIITMVANDVSLGEALDAMAASFSAIWVRHGSILRLVALPEVSTAPMLPPMMRPDLHEHAPEAAPDFAANLIELMAELDADKKGAVRLTVAQKAILQSRGFLKTTDLSRDQRTRLWPKISAMSPGSTQPIVFDGRIVRVKLVP